MPAVSAENISKSYGEIQALKDINFSVNEGELFGLIGPDGAGKTTLFKILTSLMIPDAGRAETAGFDTVKNYRDIRKIIGYMPGKFSLYPDLTIEENLNFFAAVFGTSLKENYSLIEEIYVQIEPFKKRRAGKLSGGMKQKLALCCALIHKPKVLFLDEPTTGVDSVSRAEFWEMLKRLKSAGISILVSTPYMDEASLCERIALIQAGKILKINTSEQISRDYGKPLFSLRSDNFYGLLKDLREEPFTERAAPFGDRIHLTLRPGFSPESVAKAMNEKGHLNLEFRPQEPTIEDVFLDLM